MKKVTVVFISMVITLITIGIIFNAYTDNPPNDRTYSPYAGTSFIDGNYSVQFFYFDSEGISAWHVGHSLYDGYEHDVKVNNKKVIQRPPYDSWQTNLPETNYLDTPELDSPNEADFTVGTTTGDLLNPAMYYTIVGTSRGPEYGQHSASATTAAQITHAAYSDSEVVFCTAHSHQAEFCYFVTDTVNLVRYEVPGGLGWSRSF